MSDTNELEALVHSKLAEAGYVGPGGTPTPLDEPPSDEMVDGVEDEDDGDEYEAAADEPDVEASPSDQAAATVSFEAMGEWVATLTPADYERAMSDADFASAGFRAFLDSQTDEATATKLFQAWANSGEEAEEPDDEIQEVSLAPIGQQVVQAAFESPELLPDGMSPEDWVLCATSASKGEWLAACQQAGWDPAARPSSWDLPPALEAERMRRAFAQRRDAIARGEAPYLE